MNHYYDQKSHKNSTMDSIKNFFDYGRQLTAFVAVNSIFWVFGCFTLGVGLWMYIDKGPYRGSNLPYYSAMSATGLCIAMGAAVIVIAFVGFFAARSEWHVLILAHIFFILLLVLVQITTIMLAYQYHENIAGRVRINLFHNLNSKYVSNQADSVNNEEVTWDHMQTTLKCCGVDGPSDWFNSTRWPMSSYVPDSCCDEEKFSEKGSITNCGKGISNKHLWFSQGCSRLFANWVLEHILFIKYAAVTLLCIELLVLPSSIALYFTSRRMKNKTNMSYQYSQGVPDNRSSSP